MPVSCLRACMPATISAPTHAASPWILPLLALISPPQLHLPALLHDVLLHLHAPGRRSPHPARDHEPGVSETIFCRLPPFCCRVLPFWAAPAVPPHPRPQTCAALCVRKSISPAPAPGPVQPCEIAVGAKPTRPPPSCEHPPPADVLPLLAAGSNPPAALGCASGRVAREADKIPYSLVLFLSPTLIAPLTAVLFFLCLYLVM